MCAKKEIQTGEWSHLIEVDTIETTPVTVTMVANADESAALVRRLNLLEMEGLSSEMTLLREGGGLVVYIRGRVRAQIVQRCVVTLEPVSTAIDETFEGWYADHSSAVSLAKIRKDRESKGGERPMVEECDDPEEIIDGKIDLGELAVQYLSLGIPLYPHAQGAELSADGASAAGEAGTESVHEALKNPFAKLKEWKDRQR